MYFSFQDSKEKRHSRKQPAWEWYMPYNCFVSVGAYQRPATQAVGKPAPNGKFKLAPTLLE